MPSDVQTRIALGADIAREFARLHVVAPRARLGVCAAILGVPVASVAGLDEAQAARVAVALAGCGTPGALAGLTARLERETAQ